MFCIRLNSLKKINSGEYFLNPNSCNRTFMLELVPCFVNVVVLPLTLLRTSLGLYTDDRYRVG